MMTRVIHAIRGYRVLVVVFCCLWAAAVSGYTLDEIRELKRLGFSNEQIVEMQRSNTPMPTGSAATDPAPANAGSGQASPPPAVEKPAPLTAYQARLQGLEERGVGLLVVCFSKEWIQAGPGFLYFDRRGPDSNWIPIAQAPCIGTWQIGEWGPPKIEKVRRVIKHDGHGDKHRDGKGHDDKDRKHGDGGHERVIEKTIVHQRPLIGSRYYAEFELPAGQYDVQSERKFMTDDDENSGMFKSKRHRTFWGVPVVAGKATILSYCWGPNDKFGKDHAESHRHLEWIDKVSAKFSPLVERVRR